MTTAGAVPETTSLESDDDPRKILKKVGYGQLIQDTFMRFRAADGFSHSRSFAHAAILTGVPALISIIAIATRFDQGTFRSVLKKALTGLAPGPSSRLLTEAFQQGSNNDGILTLAGALIASFVAATFTMAQVERGCNRIYGIERDRKIPDKLKRAAALAMTSGLLMGAAFIVVAAGGAIGDALGAELSWDDAAGLSFRIGRWMAGLALVFVALTLIYRFSPNRRQPSIGWLQTATTLATALWIALTGLLAFYYANNENLSDTYGPLLGIIALLTWAYASGAALLLGIAFAAQLEAIRAGVPGPRTARRFNETVGENVPEEDTDEALVLTPEGEITIQSG